MERNKCYLVELSEGTQIDYSHSRIHFATTNKRVAEEYVEKFNRIKNKVRDFYLDKESTSDDLVWWDKAYVWREVLDAKIIEVELR